MDTFVATECRGTKTHRDPEYEVINVPVLVIGAGAAGARTAIELAERDVDPLVIGKRDHGDAHTTMAAGGINAALGTHDEEDDWRIHAADTLEEGHCVNDPDAVETVAKAMPDRIRELEAWGCPFDRTGDGAIDQRYFGAQSYQRTCFVGDRTGEAVLETLVDRARELDVSYRDNVMITALLSNGSRVYGAAGYDMDDGEFVRFDAACTVLAAGGYAAMYRRHTSRGDENTADGVALAYDAGASLMDMEFVQFHPTGMVKPEDWVGRLVTEAVRGEGGQLFNAKGERFMEEYAPEEMELAARDVVTRAIEQEIRDGRGTDGGVHLDISHEDAAYIEEKLPRMSERFADLGIDLSEESVTVAPTAHYAMGGVDVDVETGLTDVDRLYAVGETSAGVHGANRLGGNSLAETVAIGPVVGSHIASRVDPSELTAVPDGVRDGAEDHFAALEAMTDADGPEDPSDLVDDLGKLLWKHAGIYRDEDGIDAGLAKLDDVRERAKDMAIDGNRTDESFELALDVRFMLVAAAAILAAAKRRTESRGAHYRTDHTEEDENWRRNIRCSRVDGELTLSTCAVDEPSQPVQNAIEAERELDYHHLE